MLLWQGREQDADVGYTWASSFQSNSDETPNSDRVIWMILFQIIPPWIIRSWRGENIKFQIFSGALWIYPIFFLGVEKPRHSSYSKAARGLVGLHNKTVYVSYKHQIALYIWKNITSSFEKNGHKYQRIHKRWLSLGFTYENKVNRIITIFSGISKFKGLCMSEMVWC